jgi:hypothetical protein
MTTELEVGIEADSLENAQKCVGEGNGKCYTGIPNSTTQVAELVSSETHKETEIQ